MAWIARELRRQLPCAVADELFDDMTFWDAARGFDCHDTDDLIVVRVYAHRSSVDQSLSDWSAALKDGASFTRGLHWYVVGPKAITLAISGTDNDPALTSSRALHTEITKKEEYLTDCILYGSEDLNRQIDRSPFAETDSRQYMALFPLVDDAVLTSMESLDLENVRRISDNDRRQARTSAAGPRIKQACRIAYRRVRSATTPLESARE